MIAASISSMLGIAAFATRSQSPVPVVAWCAIGFFFGIFLFVRGFRYLQRRRLILDTPFSKIRSASMGMIEISGQAVGPYTLVAPITARSCYYYRTLVWELKQRGKNKEWVKVAGECVHLPFFLDDNTGRVLVDPRGAELDLHCDFKQEFCDSFFTTKEPAPPNVRDFLARHGVETRNKIKVEEFCIKPKNALFVLGSLGENPGVEVSSEPIQEMERVNTSSSIFSQPLNSVLTMSIGSSSDSSATEPVGVGQSVIRLSSDPMPAKALDMSQQQKIAAALVKAGISNPAAWNAAGLDSSGVQVQANSAATGDSGHPTDDFDLHPAVVLKKGENNKTFLISWKSQREVAGALGWKCALMIPGGPVLTVLSLYLFLRFFHLL
ncbi:MAG TPA: hypothetical protein VMX38_12880 [Verrucomicrobiae bacterium]|nr:hypothetical protein [Verrucomicrobiae bacterium]